MLPWSHVSVASGLVANGCRPQEMARRDGEGDEELRVARQEKRQPGGNVA